MNDPENETLPARDWSEVPYVRVYYSVITDPKFAKVYDDDPALAGYLRLLIGADQVWPMPAPIPAWLGRRVLKLLAEVGLLIQQGTMYRMSGLDKERQSRFGQGKGRARFPSDGVPKSGVIRSDPESARSETGVDSEPVRSLAGARAHSASESSSVVTPEGGPGGTDEYDEHEALAYLASVHATVQPNGNGYHRELVKFVGRKGSTAVIAAMQRHFADGERTARQLIYGAINDLEPISKGNQPDKPRGHHGNAQEISDAFRP